MRCRTISRSASMHSMDEILGFGLRVADQLKPRRIILFGSYAYGRPRQSSDVDLLVIMPFKGNGFDLATKVLRRVNAPFGVDLIIRRPSDVARAYRQFDPLIREAVDRGKVLYESNRAPVGAKGGGGLRQRPARGPRPQSAQPRQRVLSRGSRRQLKKLATIRENP